MVGEKTPLCITIPVMELFWQHPPGILHELHQNIKGFWL
uniref:Uncharacterized protein n=1 Tax=Anguilla anguilla TaxID=7936 RepID=A0A0E9PW69_ANGAN